MDTSRRALLILMCVAFAVANDLSHLVKGKCARGGQENEACYKKLLTDLVQGMAKGVPTLNFPSMDPMSSEPLNLTVNAGSDQFKMNFLEPKFTGLSTARVSTLKVGNPVLLSLHIPVVVMSSSYVNSGKLIVIRASGGGSMSNTFEDVNLLISVPYSMVTDANGEEKVKVNDLKLKFVAKKAQMRVEKLNSGNAVARELYNIFLSASGQEILGLMSQQLNENFGGIVKRSADFMSQNLPLSAVYL